MWVDVHFCDLSEFTVVEIQNSHSGALDAYFTIVSVLTLSNLVFLRGGKIVKCLGCLVIEI